MSRLGCNFRVTGTPLATAVTFAGPLSSAYVDEPPASSVSAWSSFWTRTLSIMTLGRRKAQVAPMQRDSGKRTLHQSNSSAIWLVSEHSMLTERLDRGLADDASFLLFDRVLCSHPSCVSVKNLMVFHSLASHGLSYSLAAGVALFCIFCFRHPHERFTVQYAERHAIIYRVA